LLIGLARPIREATNRPVCCTLQGEDLFLSQIPEPYRSTALDLIRANVEHVDGFVAVSDYYAGFMGRHLGIPARKMHVVPLGINLEGHTPGPRPRTGIFTLVESYLLLRRETGLGGCTLEVAGYLAPEHRGYLRHIEQRMKDFGMEQEFNYRGVLDREHKIAFLQNLDVLSVPSAYDEPKGIFLLEAMANGVPVVQPRRGAFPEILERTGGGILVEPDNAESLAEGLLSLWKDPARRAELGSRGARGVAAYYNVSRMAAIAQEAYGKIAAVRDHA
jgi:hypothetical protein